MSDRVMCVCPGHRGVDSTSCLADATQEDFLCDHCRTLRCPSWIVGQDIPWCVTLGCPEHIVPGSRQVDPTAPF